jgi:ABC-2 type transport system permease protein
VTVVAAPAGTTASARPRTVVLGVTAKRAVRSGVGWGLIFGLYTATQALTYATGYKTLASRELLAKEFGSNPGISALVGPAIRIDTVPGYTSWKCLTVLAITGAVWGLLISTRLTRGEEDAGRWELLLAGWTTRRAAARQAVLALCAGFAALFVTTGVFIELVGRSSKVRVDAGAAWYFTLAVVAGAAMFLAVGALGGQLAATRRQAAGYAAALLGASYALRMVADSDSSLAWMRWLSPLGWIEQLRPFTSPDPWALVPIAALSVAAAAAAIILAGRRDLGASVLADHSSSRAHTALLGGPFGLSVRLARLTLVAWAFSIAAYGLLLGSIAKSGGSIFNSSPTLHAVFLRLGVSGAQAYLGVALLIMALSLGFVATGQVTATRGEESLGRLDNLLVGPVSRTRWFLQRFRLAAMAVVAGGVLAGVATWAGAAAAHARVTFPSLLDAGLNIAAPSLVVVGVGALVFGLRPRLAVPATYGVLAWSILIEITGGAAHINRWILDTSVFHQMAPAPSVPVSWTADGVMLAVGVACVAAGLAAFTRRDVMGD